MTSYKHKLTAYRRMEIQLRVALVRNDVILRQKDELIQNQALLSKASDHRPLNDLQVIVNLLPLQSRTLANAEAAFAKHQTSERV